jgi:hypothetical protein
MQSGIIESGFAAYAQCSADAAPTTEVEPSPRATRQQIRSPNALPPFGQLSIAAAHPARLLRRAAPNEGHSSGLTNRRHRPLAGHLSRPRVSVHNNDLLRYPLGRLPNKAMNLSKR